MKQLEGYYFDEERQIHGIAFSEIVSFIEETYNSCNDVLPLFKLSDLSKMYSRTLESLGLSIEGRIHGTRLKHRIMAQFEDLREYKDGREVILAFNSEVGEALTCAASIDYDDEGDILAEAARIIRRDVLNFNTSNFNGQFEPNCQQTSTPKSLLALINMTLRGQDLDETGNPFFLQATMTISQLISFNMIQRIRKSSHSAYHNQKREPPFAVNLAKMIHAQTRKLGIVEKLFKLGLCVSPDRLRSIATALGNTSLDTFAKQNVVCPMLMQKGLFTIGAIDNIDVNPSSATAMSSFHGTAASLHQKAALTDTVLQDNLPELSSSKVLKDLPSEYTDIPPFYLPSSLPPFKSLGQLKVTDTDSNNFSAEHEWLDHVKTSLKNQASPKSWAAYNASSQVPICDADTSALFPMWRESSKSPAMIKHAMDVIIKATKHLNESQTSVIAFDQPLYAIAKTIQWALPNEYGPSELVVMLGPLHIEMAYLSALGDWLENSGWTTLIQNASVTRSGVAESLLSGHDVVRTKYCHQITACVLNSLMHKAYDQYSATAENQLDFKSWCIDMESQYPQFKYWFIALQLQLILLSFLRSVRSGNFILYKASLQKMLPWFFALDHYHYARWLSIHWYDMTTLNDTNLEIAEAFSKGSFVISRTRNKFSSMGIDQCHEQLNKIVKGDGGAVGLTEDEDMLRRWSICGPEISRMVQEFEHSTVLHKVDSSVFRHHEENPAFQKRFQEDCKSLEIEFEKLGNPFICTENDTSLLQLDTRDVMSDDIVESIRTAEEIGRANSKNFITQRLVDRSYSLDAPIKKIKLQLLSSSNRKSNQSVRSEKKQVQKDVTIFAQMYIST